MKILDWFKRMLSKNKKDYILNEGNSANEIVQDKKDFVPKVDVNNIVYNKSREDIIRSVREDMIIEDLSEEYNYTKFSPENVRAKYGMVSDEDIQALSCLSYAIKEGNRSYCKAEIVNRQLMMRGNKINDFLKESPNNIVVLINLMEEEARKSHEKWCKEKLEGKTIFPPPKKAESLITSSYENISKLIEEYRKENAIEEK